MTGEQLYNAFAFAERWTNPRRWTGLSPHTRTAWDEAAKTVTKLGQGLFR